MPFIKTTILSAAALLAQVAFATNCGLTTHDYPSAINAPNNPPTCAVPWDSLDLSRVAAYGGIKSDKDPKCGSCAKICSVAGCQTMLVIDMYTGGGEHFDISTGGSMKIVGDVTGVFEGTHEWVDVSECADIWDGRMFFSWDSPQGKLAELKSKLGGAPQEPAPVEQAPPAPAPPAPAPAAPSVYTEPSTAPAAFHPVAESTSAAPYSPPPPAYTPPPVYSSSSSVVYPSYTTSTSVYTPPPPPPSSSSYVAPTYSSSYVAPTTLATYTSVYYPPTGYSTAPSGGVPTYYPSGNGTSPGVPQPTTVVPPPSTGAAGRNTVFSASGVLVAAVAAFALF